MTRLGIYLVAGMYVDKAPSQARDRDSSGEQRLGRLFRETKAGEIISQPGDVSQNYLHVVRTQNNERWFIYLRTPPPVKM